MLKTEQWNAGAEVLHSGARDCIQRHPCLEVQLWAIKHEVPLIALHRHSNSEQLLSVRISFATFVALDCLAHYLLRDLVELHQSFVDTHATVVARVTALNWHSSVDSKSCK